MPHAQTFSHKCCLTHAKSKPSRHFFLRTMTFGTRLLPRYAPVLYRHVRAWIVFILRWTLRAPVAHTYIHERSKTFLPMNQTARSMISLWYDKTTTATSRGKIVLGGLDANQTSLVTHTRAIDCMQVDIRRKKKPKHYYVGLTSFDPRLTHWSSWMLKCNLLVCGHGNQHEATTWCYYNVAYRKEICHVHCL